MGNNGRYGLCCYGNENLEDTEKQNGLIKTKHEYLINFKMQLSAVQPVFKLELNHKVTPDVVTIAKYDGTHPCLTASAGYDKIIIHHPHGGVASGRAQRSQAHSEVSELNLSQAIIALAAGPLRPDTGRDMLLIGSPTQILAYDVHDNTDLFFKEAPDGVNVIIAGFFGKHTETLAIIGGNSSVQAIDWQGNEVFWNVVSGKVCAMITFDFDKDGENELLIGCDDSFIRVLKNNQFIAEIAETGPILCLSPVNEVRFAYGLANGTIGIYEEGIRLWRVKSKQNALALQWSGETLACCWSNGRIDWREGNTGRVLRRVQMRANAAAMLLADYRSVGAPDLVCVSDRGEVLGYPPYQENTGFNSASKNMASEEDRLAITELFNKKQALMVELQHYEANAASGSVSLENLERPASAMPTNTRLQVAVLHTVDEGCLQLAVSTNNETIVRAALVLAEGIFETGETFVRHPHPSKLRSLLHVPLRPPRDVPVDVHIKSIAQFPEAEKKLREEMDHVSQIGEMRSRLAAETAERAQLITALLPAAQDAAAYDLKEMLNRYKEVVMLNEELLTGCYIRRSTQEQAVTALKSLHTILQQAVRLRVGKYGKAVVAASRKAVQDNNIEALIKIIQVGDSSMI
ncbi:Bardet-Biedl syndrome 2 protein homolog isoform X2 [Helicoverpa zea]|uniref:Bardet-Biedl syndrome 2 protein homolog isoform X2 n=1 Tax=Helicoverpa zea TaxID=7113 RepID=UPI001F5A5E5E|nr:Bardet-Biedl syndrome 2 protein homolog isoform X2 [Helicoverpa zea]